MMQELITTFPSGLRYRCDIETCSGCCSLFEEIEIDEGDVKRLEKFGYTSFYEGKGGTLLLKKPCSFSRGKLCEIHLTHGYDAKPEACKKYPFTLSVLDNGWMMVDVKWACPGVGLEKGDLLTTEYIEKELLSFLELSRIQVIKIKEMVPLWDGSKSRIPLSGVKVLYDYASKSILFTKSEPKEKITALTSLITRFSQESNGRRITEGRVSEILQSLTHEALELGSSLADQEVDYYGLIDSLLGFELNPVSAGQKLGLKFKLTAPGDAGFSRDAGRLYSVYLSQCLMETLSKPWSLRASFFWALGVMGIIDFVSRAMATDEVGKDEIRSAIAVVDYLNKGFDDYRNYAYPLYPELGLSYLGVLMGNGRQ